jgi:hypothetical protein
MRRPGDHVDAHGREPVGVVVGLGDRLLHRPDPVPHLLRVDVGIVGREPEAVGVAHDVGRLRRRDQ